MTQWLDVSDLSPTVSYTAGSAQTIFAVPFVFFADADLKVYVNGVQQTLTTHYTVSGALDPPGGTITFLTAPTSGAAVLITRDLPVALTTHIPPSGPLDVPGLNVQFSRLVAMMQQFESNLARALRVPLGETAADIPALSARAGLVAAYDAFGNPSAVSSAFLSLGIGQRGQVRLATTQEIDLGNINGNDSFTKVLLAFAGADGSTVFTDSNAGGSAHTWTASGDAQIDTGVTILGAPTGLFDGTTDYITTPDSPDFNLAALDWTIDGRFVCTAAAGSFKNLAGQVDAASTAASLSFQILRFNTNVIFASVNVGGASFSVSGTTQFTNAVNTGPHHFEFSRSGGTLRLFIDGVLEGSTAIAGTINNSAANLSVGRLGDAPGSEWQGSVGQFRLTLGVARHTANFTPPTKVYTNQIDSVVMAPGDLVLVKDQTDKTTNGVYVVPSGGAPAATRSTAWDTYAELLNSLIIVEAGSVNAFSLWINTNNTGGTLGVTSITFAKKTIDALAIGPSALPFLNVTILGAVGDGLRDNLVPIQVGLDTLDAAGGGVLFFPRGTYRVSDQINVGNGSNSAESTKHHRIRLVGESYGGAADLSATETDGASRILYDGAVNSAKAVLSLEGPLHSGGVENLQFDANDKAGGGIRINHCTSYTFSRVATRKCTVVGWDLLTRTGFPAGVGYGNADNRYYDCYNWLPTNFTMRGISFSSGVNPATSLAGKPDSARNIFIGGTFLYGGNASSYGAYFSGADNNQIIGTLFFPKGGSAGGFDVFFQQWAGSGDFPKENVCINVGMTRGVDGNGGVGPSGGNFFWPFQTGDGAAPPTLDTAQAMTHDGRTYINGVRALRGRQIVQAVDQTNRVTTSAVLADITGYSVTLTTKASTTLLIRYALTGDKTTAGTGFVIANIDTTDFNEMRRDLGSTGFQSGLVAEFMIAVAAGAHTIKLRFASSDANAFTIRRGVLTVQELY